jgi:hypothetical protein
LGKEGQCGLRPAWLRLARYVPGLFCSNYVLELPSGRVKGIG